MNSFFLRAGLAFACIPASSFAGADTSTLTRPCGRILTILPHSQIKKVSNQANETETLMKPKQTIETAEEIIKLLNLTPLLSEGGYYRQTFKSSLNVQINDRGHIRSAGTGIYYLITPEDFSALHRVKHDEIFHFY